MRAVLPILCGALLASGTGHPTATTEKATTAGLANVRAGLQQLAIDKDATYRVRELALSEGGAKFYLSEGVLAFATPVDGQRIAAVYTIAPVEAGDAEVISLPPLPAERASLARFTKSPNLDEHFTSALLFFANNTADDLLRQIRAQPVHPAPDLAAEIGMHFDEALRRSAAEIEVTITQSILDRHRPANGFFCAMLAGRRLGALDFIYQPDQPDTSIFGRVAERDTLDRSAQGSYFQIWSAFRPRNAPEPPPVYQMADYHIDTTIHADLSMTSVADFDYQADSDDGSVISLFLTPRLHVTSASIDGERASVMMHASPRTADIRGAVNFLLINAAELTPGSHHRVRVEYEGSVIRRMPAGSYFVDDRNAWYPLITPMLTEFDLTFHCPENLRVVATGDPVAGDLILNGQRTVHRRTAKAQALAGFNLGEFQVEVAEHPPYRIEICSNAQTAAAPNLDGQTAQILKYFTDRWMRLSGHSISITPIEGNFGQGFPGLIYLSTVAYLQEKDRPQGLRNASLDSFFSRLLLPHELAHQWWGNIVTPADYRSDWIMEAMSNYSALQYLEQVQGQQVMDDILAEYRGDLIRRGVNGELVDSFGPVTFDQRLENNFGTAIWHHILYEKGTWIFQMLRQRMGASGFRDFQVKILKDYARRPITNEDLRQEAESFLLPGQPDRQLKAFFDTWVYDTGIPVLSIRGGMLEVSGVPDTYTIDVPLGCGPSEKKASGRNASGIRWVHANSGEWPLPAGHCSLPPVTQFLYQTK